MTRASFPLAALLLLAAPAAAAGDEPALRIAGAQITESTSHAVFIVTMSAATDSAVTVGYRTVEDTADAPKDFAAQEGTIRFRPGATTRTVSIRIKEDRVDERDERFLVRLFDPRGATLGRARAAAVILDNDPESKFEGTWSGTTSQDQPISFVVDQDGRVISLEVSYTVRGFRCSWDSTVAFGPPARIRRDRFTASYVDDADDVTVKGVFSSRNAVSGTIDATHGAKCDGSVNPTWSATRA
jgi:hypothetical protein